jgi:hypothetical protein
MAELQKEKIKKETLRWVNKIRRENGKGNLPRLRKGNAVGMSCPITNSLRDCLGDRIHTTFTEILEYYESCNPRGDTRGPVLVMLPSEARTFIHLHGRSAYPELWG